MKQYQYAAKLAKVGHLNDIDLYDTWADIICPLWSVTEYRGEVNHECGFIESLQCNLSLSDIDAMLQDFAMHATSMEWAVTE